MRLELIFLFLLLVCASAYEVVANTPKDCPYKYFPTSTFESIFSRNALTVIYTGKGVPGMSYSPATFGFTGNTNSNDIDDFSICTFFTGANPTSVTAGIWKYQTNSDTLAAMSATFDKFPQMPPGAMQLAMLDTTKDIGDKYNFYETTISTPGSTTTYAVRALKGQYIAGVTFYDINDRDKADELLRYAIDQLDESIQATPNNTGVTCRFSGKNLCQPVATQCSAASCSQYVASINKYAGGAATISLLKSIMFRESSCNPRASSGSSFGLMQLQPSTANMFAKRCGVNERITTSWLTNPANADASVCISANYIRSIASGTCGSSVRNIAAGYNGGTGVCKPSTDCAGEIGCSGQPVQRWECLYDNTQHTICNTGYDQSRDYAGWVSYCNDNPGF